MSIGPFYIALVDPTETTFDPVAHKREDLKFVSGDIDLIEDKCAVLTAVVKNPHVGLLAPGRKRWIWLSWTDSTTLFPLFFGALMAIPDNLFAEKLTLKFVARPLDYVAQKRALAQTLKTPPAWDEIFIELSRQQDPDAVLEGRSAFWHVNHITHEVSISDALDGEDGTEVFEDDEVPYASLNYSVGESPLTAVHVAAEVNWIQRAQGAVDLGQRNFVTYTGDGMIAEWPKQGADLGGGWTAGTSVAIDVLGTASAYMFSTERHYQNTEKKHHDLDLLSFNETSSKPIGPVGFHQVLSDQQLMTVGFPDMQFVSQLGTTSGGQALESFVDYPGTAPSFRRDIKDFNVLIWNVSTQLEVRYDKVERQRQEHLYFTVQADVQPVLAALDTLETVDPVDIETISPSSLDVGSPVASTATLTSDNGSNVSNGDTVTIRGDVYVFQNVLTEVKGHVLIGGDIGASLTNLANAINVNQTGVAGVDFALANTASQTVVAVVLDGTHMRVTALNPLEQTLVAETSNALNWRSAHSFSLSGETNFAPGDTVRVGNITYTFDDEIRLIDVQLTQTQHVFNQVPYTLVIGSSVEASLLTLAAAINASGGAGSDYGTGTLQNPLAIATEINGTLTVSPRYAASVFTVATSSGLVWDDTVTTLVPDPRTIPIGDVSRRSFFPTARGLRAIEHLLLRARARLRLRARCVKVVFDCRFERAIVLTTRMNATIIDARLPGGQATGKITSVKIRAGGDGKMRGTVTIGCAVGNGGHIDAVTGNPTYVEEGYVGPGYQAYTGDVTLVGDDIGYSVPVDVQVDANDISFPLSRASAVISERVISNYISQQDRLQLAWDQSHPQPGGSLHTEEQRQQELMRNTIAELTKHHVVYELILRPLNGGPFSKQYDITTTKLTILKQIDLAAAA